MKSFVFLAGALLLLDPGAFAGALAGEWQWAPVGKCPTETWRLEEVWRLGPESDPLIYGTVAVERDAQGNVYLLNAVLNQVQVYDAEGRFVRTILREGEGPGEVTTPLDMSFTPTGDLCVLQGFPGRLIVVDTRGEPVDTLRPQENRSDAGPFAVFMGLVDGGPTPLLATQQRQILGPTTVEMVECVWRLDEGLLCEDKVLEKRTRYELLDYELREVDVYHPLWNQIAADASGRVLRAPAWSEYRIVSLDAEGARDLVTVDYPDLERSASIRDDVREDLESSPLAHDRPPRRVHVEDSWPAIISMRVDDHGAVWVLSSRGFRTRAEGEIYSYDVFSRTGEFIKKVSLRGPGWNEYPAVHFLDEDTMGLFTQGYDYEDREGEEGEFILCRVIRPTS